MENHRLINTLKTLSSAEFKAFVRYVNTDYFNKKEDIKQLLGYLKKYYPSFTGKHIEKSYLLVRNFPDEKLESRFLDDLMYNTQKLLEQFLVLEALNNQPAVFAKVLVDSYRERDLYEPALKVIDKNKKVTYKNLSIEELYNNFNDDLNQYFMNPGSYKKDAIESLTKANLSLEVFYWSSKLWLNDELQARKEVIGEAEDLLKGEDAAKIEMLLKQTDHVILKILFFLNFPERELSFEDVKAIYKENIASFDKKLNAKLITGLINYCKKQYAAKQDMSFLNEWFKLYKLGYDYNLFVKDNKINDTTFLNIVHLALIHKEFIWVREYISKNVLFLSEANLANLANAMLNFEEKKYQDVVSDLNEIAFGHIHQNLTSRSLLVKACFELEDFDLLENHLKAFEVYLRRQKDISEALQEANLNFVKSVRKLVKVPFDKKMASSLKEDLDAKSIAYKLWLREKLH